MRRLVARMRSGITCDVIRHRTNVSPDRMNVIRDHVNVIEASDECDGWSHGCDRGSRAM